MSLSEIEYAKEEEYLNDVIYRIESELSTNSTMLEEAKELVYEVKKYFWENKNEIDGAERVNLEIMINQDTDKGNMAIKRIEILDRIKGSPYFGKIDFYDNEFEELINVYIGLTSIKDKENIGFLVYDWRSPIASMYYEYGIGKALYKAPVGDIHGEIQLKRQYKIEKGKIKFVIDNDLNIEDELLKEALARNTSEKMRNIVNSIQQEQNQVIRNDSNEVLVVQGSAGSGKTSVALHRIAYLLYKERDFINSGNILIFSPSDVFSDYISNVLPELGEENVLQTTFSEYAKKFLKEYSKIEGFIEQLEKIYKQKEDIKFRELSIKVKMDAGFKEILDTYLVILEKQIEFKNLALDGKVVITKKEFKKMFEIDYKDIKFKNRIEKIIDRAIMLHNDGTLKKSEINLLKNHLHEQIAFEFNMKKIYMDMYYNEEIQNLIKEKYNFNRITDLFFYSIESLKGKVVNYEDSICLLYLKGKIGGFFESESIKYIVIDEAQDYSLLQYEILKNIFVNAKFTILGDINQSINPYMDYKSFSSVIEIFRSKKSMMIELYNCYRSSYEINMLANDLLKIENLNPIKREEGYPTIIKGRKKSELITFIMEDLETMLEKEFKQIALVCKGNKDVTWLYNKIKSRFENVNCVKSDHDFYEKGIVIIPAYLTKGLEFDGVLVYCSQDESYLNELERNLLYVVCTRALHELKIYSESNDLGLLNEINKDLYRLID